MSETIPPELLELKTAKRFQLNLPVGTTARTGCPCLCQHPWEIVAIFHAIKFQQAQEWSQMNLQTPRSNLSSWTSPLCFLFSLSQICSLAKSGTWISNSYTCLSPFWHGPYDPITHPRWNMSKDSKLCLWEIIERWNAHVDIISFPPLPNAYIQTGQRKHTLRAFSCSVLWGPDDFISTSWDTIRALVHFQSLHLSRGTSKVFTSTPPPEKTSGDRPQVCCLPRTTGFPADWVLTSACL